MSVEFKSRGDNDGGANDALTIEEQVAEPYSADFEEWWGKLKEKARLRLQKELSQSPELSLPKFSIPN